GRRDWLVEHVGLNRGRGRHRHRTCALVLHPARAVTTRSRLGPDVRTVVVTAWSGARVVGGHLLLDGPPDSAVSPVCTAPSTGWCGPRPFGHFCTADLLPSALRQPAGLAVRLG